MLKNTVDNTLIISFISSRHKHSIPAIRRFSNKLANIVFFLLQQLEYQKKIFFGIIFVLLTLNLQPKIGDRPALRQPHFLVKGLNLSE